MKQELIDRISIALSNAKHVCSQPTYKFVGNIEATPMEVYLVNKIEKLEKEIQDMKINHKSFSTKKGK